MTSHEETSPPLGPAAADHFTPGALPEAGPPPPRTGAVVGMLLFGICTLSVLVGAVVGMVWIAADPLVEAWQQWRQSRQPALVQPSPVLVRTTARLPSLEEVLSRNSPPTDEQLVVLRQGEAEYIKKAVQAADEGQGRRAVAAWRTLGDIRSRMRSWRAAASAYSHAYQAVQELLDEQDTDKELRLDHARLILRAAQCLAKCQHGAEAENLAQQALNLGQHGAEFFAQDQQFRAHVAQTHLLLADLYYRQDRPADGEDQEHLALRLYVRLVKAHPEHDGYRLAYAGLMLTLGERLLRHERAADAQPCFQEAVRQLQEKTDFSPPSAEQRLLLATAFLRQGHLQKAIQTVQGLEDAKYPGEIHFGLACFYAQASDCTASDNRERWAKQALALLGQLQEQDFFRDPEDCRRVREDRRLFPLRMRPAFQLLRQEVERRQRPRPLLET